MNDEFSTRSYYDDFIPFNEYNTGPNNIHEFTWSPFAFPPGDDAWDSYSLTSTSRYRYLNINVEADRKWIYDMAKDISKSRPDKMPDPVVNDFVGGF